MDFRVAIDAYHGPLDLLLQLVRKEELPIAELPDFPHALLEPSTWANVDDFGASGADDADDTAPESADRD